MAIRKTEHGLTPKQERFCQEYVKHFNGSKAAVDAGYAAKNSDVQSAQLLSLPKIQERIATLNKRVFDLNSVTAERILEELASIGFSRLTDVVEFDADGAYLKDSKTLDEKSKAAIESVTITETFRGEAHTVKTSVKMYNKLDALEKLARRIKFYPKETPVIDAVRLLLEEGIASPEQAKVVADGIAGIRESLRQLSQSQAS